MVFLVEPAVVVQRYDVRGNSGLRFVDLMDGRGPTGGRERAGEKRGSMDFFGGGFEELHSYRRHRR